MVGALALGVIVAVVLPGNPIAFPFLAIYLIGAIPAALAIIGGLAAGTTTVLTGYNDFLRDCVS